MKSLLSFFSAVLLSVQIFSQSGWLIQKGGAPHLRDYFLDLYFFSDGTGWILSRNEIKHSTNNGNNWTNYYFKDTSITYVSKIYFIDHSNGWMLGNKLFKTSNAGQNWAGITVLNNVNRLYFLNLLTGWYCGDSGVLKKTIDGGFTWSELSTGISENFNDVYFLNSQTGIVAADAGKILRTTNAGVNWTIFNDNVTYSYMKRIKFVDNSTGFISGSFGYIFKTTNTGANWSILNSSSFNSIKDMAFQNTLTGFTCGLNGDIYRTTNGGTYWYRASSNGLHANTFGIELAGSGRLWVIADSAGVYKSDDNAANWNEVYRLFITEIPLYSIRFFNQTTGCACGDSGVIVRTTNTGANWVNITSGTSAPLRKLFFTDNLTGFAAGGLIRNVILKTTNSGLSWFPVSSDSTSYLNSVFFLNSQTGWCCGNGISNILKTINGGINWHKINTGDLLFQLKDIYFVNENTGFLINNSRCYKTMNGGANWQILPGSTSGYCLNFTNSNTGMYLGSAGGSFLFKTTNSGVNWIVNQIGPSTMYSMYFINQSKGWVCGNAEAGKIKITTNSGSSWIQQDIVINSGLNSIFFVNENEGWACGEFGTILHTTTGGIGIKQLSNNVPLSYVLHQNYPNPFNPVTKIRFDIPLNSRHRGNDNVVLKVYDILGKEITTLVNQLLQPGVYEVDFNGSNFADGVYFYALSAGEFRFSKKMILVK